MSGADPGFPVRGRGPILRGCGPLIRVHFGENICENKRIGSHMGCRGRGVCRKSLYVDPPMGVLVPCSSVSNILGSSFT